MTTFCPTLHKIDAQVLAYVFLRIQIQIRHLVSVYQKTVSQFHDYATIMVYSTIQLSTNRLTICHIESISSLSDHTHTHIHTHTLPHAHTQTHTLTHPRSHTLPYTHVPYHSSHFGANTNSYSYIHTGRWQRFQIPLTPYRGGT